MATMAADGGGVETGATPEDEEAAAGGFTVSLGTMTFGWKQSSQRVDDPQAKQLLQLFVSRGHSELDTALMYAGGQTEQLLGRVLAGDLRKRTRLATKANPNMSRLGEGHDKVGGLRPDMLTAQVERSLSQLRVGAVEILYLHAPDTASPIEPTLEAVAKLHSEGKFRELGLSNYQAWEVAHIYHLCKAHGWVLPTVYQGMYNAVTREVERELLPCLRAMGIRFLAYNPLAGGMLTGKHRAEEPVAKGRFKGNQEYMTRYWKPAYMDLDCLQAACRAEGITTTCAALRWLRHHSALRAERRDGVVIGASKLEHLEENLDAVAAGPLPVAVVEAFDQMWTLCRADCPSYERGHSAIAAL